MKNLEKYQVDLENLFPLAEVDIVEMGKDTIYFSIAHKGMEFIESNIELKDNLLYIGGINRSPIYSGNDIIIKLIQFARNNCISKIQLTDASYLCNKDFKCCFSLAKFYLLTKNKRWYSKFGFEQTGYTTKPGLFKETYKQKELEIVDEINKIKLGKIKGLKSSTINFIRKLLKQTVSHHWKLETIKKLFNKINELPRLSDNQMCFIKDIFDGIKFNFYDIKWVDWPWRGDHLELKLPNYLLQSCYDMVPKYIETKLPHSSYRKL